MAFSQKTLKVFLDENLQEVREEKARFIKITYKDTSRYQITMDSVKVFYKNGKTKSILYYKNEKAHGEYKTYFANGHLEIKGYYQNHYPVGTWQYWYQNGQLKEEDLMEKDANNQVNSKILNFWDSTGVQHIKQGTGEYLEWFDNSQLKVKGFFQNSMKDRKWQSWFKDGKPYYEEIWEKGYLKIGTSYNQEGQKFEYDSTNYEIQATPINGMQSFYSYIGKSLKYPQEAEKSEIEGKVLIQFTVDKDGSIIDANVLKGIGGGCDEEALRVVKQAPKWSPGVQKGQKVKMRLTLPVQFKLN